MLKEIYNERKEYIDSIIRNSIKKAEKRLYNIDNMEDIENRDNINKIEENYNIKLGIICEELYIQGFKDGVNLINECR